MIRLLRMDALRLRRDRLSIAVLIIGVLACALAVVSGMDRLSRMQGARAAGLQDAAAARTQARAAWAEAPAQPPEEAVLLPSRAMTDIQLAAPVLPDFSAGRSDIEPAAATARLSTRPDALFTRYQVGNAEGRFRGNLDLGFVAVVLAPLLLIGLGHGVFAADRESGIARLWLAQAGTPLRLIAMRSLNRLGLVCLPLLIASLILWLAGPDPAARAGPIAGWFGVAVLGLLFWWAVILLVNAFTKAAETAALLLVGIWAMLVFVIPACIAAAAATFNPLPSRFEQIAAARATEVRASRDYDDDHPELAAATLEGRRSGVLKGIEVRRSVGEAVAPLQERYERQLAAQRDLLSWLGLMSPPAVSAEALAAVARTDADFYSAQRRAAIDFLAPHAGALADAALGRTPINVATFDSLPRFSPPTTAPRLFWPVSWLMLVTSLLMAWSLLRLRRAQPF